jgi:hypothetical protein
MAASGVAVLERGLPPLPGKLDRHMAVPMAHWIAGDKAVVLTLCFSRNRRTWRPLALHTWNAPALTATFTPWHTWDATAIRATFTRRNGAWEAADRRWHGTGFHDPFRDPGDLRGLGGRALVYSGSAGGVSSGTILHGVASADVAHLAIIQDGHEDRRPLDNHFGAWVIRTTKPGPFTVAAIDKNGSTIDQVQYPDGRRSDR